MPLTRRQICRYLATGAFSLGTARAASPLAGVIAAGHKTAAASGPAFLSATSKGGRDSFTTTPIDTTGAGLIVLALAWFGGATEPSISDSQSNTWTNLTLGNANYPYVRLKYCLAPSTSGSHTISSSHSNAYLGLAVAAFSGITSYDAQQNGGTQNNGTTLSSGSVTPTGNAALIVSSLGLAGAGQTTSIDSGFSVATHLAGSSSNWYGSDLAYLIQTTAAAINPQWSWGSSTAALSRIAVFR